MVIAHGPEEMKKRELIAALRKAIAAEIGDTEPKFFDGGSVEPADVFDYLRTPSMFNPFNLVVVDQAEDFVSKHRELLERYAAAPADAGCLVLQALTWRPGNLDKLVAKIGAKIKCDEVKQPEAIGWIVSRAKERWGADLPRESADRLVRRRGTSLMRLDVELGKLAAAAGEGKVITPQLVDEMVSKTSDEQAWALQDALLDTLLAQNRDGAGGRAGTAIEKLHEIVDLSGQSEILVSYAVADLMRRLWLALCLQQRGAPEGQIASQVRVFGPKRADFFRLLRKLNRSRVARLLDQAIEADRRSKTGLGTPIRNLECFCIHLVDAFS